MSRLSRKRDAQDRQNGQKSCLTCYQQMRRGSFTKMALDHEDKAGSSSLDDLMPAESQTEPVLFMQEIAKFHEFKPQMKHSSHTLSDESSKETIRFTEN